MKTRQVPRAIAVSVALLALAAVAYTAQAKATAPQLESSDPAIRWQFDTHG
jgi:hypothetical protein